MKKIILIFIVFYSGLYSDDNYERKLYEKVLSSVFTNNHIRIYTNKDEIKTLLKSSNIFIIVPQCDKTVDLIIGKNFKSLQNICTTKPIFATNYSTFINNTNSFGAFYWRKGRPQLRLKKEGLQKYDLTIPDSFKRYLQ